MTTDAEKEWGFDRCSWDGAYASGAQCNRYPSDGVVSLCHNLLRGRVREKTHILEIGCGAGNNAWFFAREGFKVTAVDGSCHCLDYARNRFAQDGLCCDFQQLTFLELDSLQGPYDLILDRAALAHNHWDDLVRIMPRVHRLMDENSWFMSFFFADDHPDKRYMKRNEGVTWLEPQAEVFGGAQWVTLLDEAHVRTLFAPFTIVDMYKRTLHSLMRDEPFTGNSEWIVICKKK